MVFDIKLLMLACSFTPDFNAINLLHDGWLSRVCFANGGISFYDEYPNMSYRIHERNDEENENGD